MLATAADKITVPTIGLNDDAYRAIDFDPLRSYMVDTDLRLADRALEVGAVLEPWTNAGDPEDLKLGRVIRLIEAGRDLAKIIEGTSPSFVSKARQFAQEGNDQGALVVSGLYLPGNVTTFVPKDRYFPSYDPATRGLAMLAIGVALHFGDPYTYETNPMGAAETIICSVASLPEIPGRTLSGINDLGMHTELVGAEFKPKFVTLTCVRGQDDVPTLIVPAKRVVDRLSPDDLSILSEERFITEDGLVPGSSDKPHPLVKERYGRPCLEYAEGLTRPLNAKDKAARLALGKFEAVIAQPDVAETIYLCVGRVLIFDNSGLHGRGAYRPKERPLGLPQTPDDLPRWAARIMIGDELHHAQNISRGRNPRYPSISPV